MRRGLAASPLSDAELTRAAQAGDAGSLGVLLARHEAGMRAVALGMIGYGPDTDDVVQDASLVAVRRISDVRNPAAVGAWLRAVVRNECRMWLRSRRAGDRGGEILSALPSEDPMPEELIDCQLLQDWVCSSEATRKDLGWEPRVPWNEGVVKAVAWYRENGWL